MTLQTRNMQFYSERMMRRWELTQVIHRSRCCSICVCVCVCTLLTPRSESTVFIWVRLPHSQLLESWLMLYVKQPPLTISHLEGNFSPSFLLSSSFSHAFSGLQSSTVGLLHSLYVHIKRSFLKKKNVEEKKMPGCRSVKWHKIINVDFQPCHCVSSESGNFWVVSFGVSRY